MCFAIAFELVTVYDTTQYTLRRYCKLLWIVTVTKRTIQISFVIYGLAYPDTRWGIGVCFFAPIFKKLLYLK